MQKIATIGNCPRHLRVDITDAQIDAWHTAGSDPVVLALGAMLGKRLTATVGPGGAEYIIRDVTNGETMHMRTDDETADMLAEIAQWWEPTEDEREPPFPRVIFLEWVRQKTQVARPRVVSNMELPARDAALIRAHLREPAFGKRYSAIPAHLSLTDDQAATVARLTESTPEFSYT